MQTEVKKNGNGKNGKHEETPKAPPRDVVNLSAADVEEMQGLSTQIQQLEQGIVQRAVLMAELNALADGYRTTVNKRIERVQQIARSHDMKDISQTHDGWDFDAEGKTLSFIRK